MERRTFVQTGVAGALGFVFQPNVSPLLSPVRNDIHLWFNQFCKLIQARRYWSPRVLTSDDLHAKEALDAYFSQRFFQRESNSIYVHSGAKSSYFFYPVYLRHAQVGITDVLLPVFMRQQNQSWQRIGTFTGFQIEAMARAAVALHEQGLNVADLLLPVSVGKPDGAAFQYETRMGSVSISTLVQQKASTSIRVQQDDGKPVLEMSFQSQHCLYAELT